MPYKTISNVVTQKARGLLALENLGNEFDFEVPDFSIDDDPEGVYPHGERFTRACPKTPRHGFVESRITHNPAEIRKVLKEARAVDPEAEIIIMPVIKALASAIWTPGLLTLGPGNDGATLGKGAKPLEVTGDLTTPRMRYHGGITQSPYMEFVYGSWSSMDPQLYLVQLRDGPPLPSGVKDFIPTEMVVGSVVELSENSDERPDLLAWEKMVEDFPEGTVVYHPMGGLADHYSVHCMLQYKFKGKVIPVLTTHKPEVGDTLKIVTPPSPKPDPEEARRGFKVATQMKFQKGYGLDRYRPCVMAMLAGVHNMGVWMGHHDRLIGFGMGMAFRLCHTACIGELRHRFKTEIGYSKTVNLSGAEGRNRVFDKYFNRTLVTRYMLPKAIGMFYDENVEWGGAFGGHKWGDFAWGAVTMYNQLAKGQYQEASQTYNKLIYMAHNGGWAFNKFIASDVMDKAAKAGAYPVLMALPLYLEMLQPTLKFRIPAWSPLPEPTKIVTTVTRVPIAVQVKFQEGPNLWAQVKWSLGERTHAHLVEASILAKKIIKKHLTGNGPDCTTSMGGTPTVYVSLHNDGDYVWYTQWGDMKEPVTVVEPETTVDHKEIIFPEYKKVKDENDIVIKKVPKKKQPTDGKYMMGYVKIHEGNVPIGNPLSEVTVIDEKNITISSGNDWYKPSTTGFGLAKEKKVEGV